MPSKLKLKNKKIEIYNLVIWRWKQWLISCMSLIESLRIRTWWICIVISILTSFIQSWRSSRCVRLSSQSSSVLTDMLWSSILTSSTGCFINVIFVKYSNYIFKCPWMLQNIIERSKEETYFSLHIPDIWFIKIFFYIFYQIFSSDEHTDLYSSFPGVWDIKCW